MTDLRGTHLLSARRVLEKYGNLQPIVFVEFDDQVSVFPGVPPGLGGDDADWRSALLTVLTGMGYAAAKGDATYVGLVFDAWIRGVDPAAEDVEAVQAAGRRRQLHKDPQSTEGLNLLRLKLSDLTVDEATWGYVRTPRAGKPPCFKWGGMDLRPRAGVTGSFIDALREGVRQARAEQGKEDGDGFDHAG